MNERPVIVLLSNNFCALITRTFGFKPPLILAAQSFDCSRPCIGWMYFEMARPGGLEPPTLCLEGRCSIQLSYGRTHEVNNSKT